jgi:hypothetical protein
VSLNHAHHFLYRCRQFFWFISNLVSLKPFGTIIIMILFFLSFFQDINFFYNKSREVILRHISYLKVEIILQDIMIDCFKLCHLAVKYFQEKVLNCLENWYFIFRFLSWCDFLTSCLLKWLQYLRCFFFFFCEIINRLICF